ncbi:heat-inducible transcriptional repressor HrcA [Thermodesulforhabdus norvegica]|uniref:Heat-inducible transcription repressor HrcA n=1 Tax=Thermodesulforhabdus norvegica TaxID=39841 RepID=A0A1I4R1M3_9BACT|nr:heat-inducible transcriptional repressor HrcA [Thermodesulforhabdus norvegica]SFM46147.1 heat-inducible transcription repressor HrcA [Thermodesulforhabdus norvegica]
MTAELSPRDQSILRAVVLDYIKSGEPVGSRTVSKKYMKNLSSATIRNIMADLEDLGYLYQPHTSAGRIPTEKGLRFYLEFLMEWEELEKKEKEVIRQAYMDVSGIEDVLKRTTHVLSSLCAQAALVLWPRLSATRLRRIEFVRLHQNHVLTILVAESGIIHHRLIILDEDISQEELDRFGRYINETYGNLTLEEIKNRIIKELQEEKALFDRIYNRAVTIIKEALQLQAESTEMYIEGQSKLLDNPEFTDIERLKKILEAFEDKSRILKLLDVTMESTQGVQIILGPESNIQDLENIGIVSSPYKRGETVLGVVGVIGPLRMDYPKIVPIVDFTARVLSEVLQNPEKGDICGEIIQSGG